MVGSTSWNLIWLRVKSNNWSCPENSKAWKLKNVCLEICWTFVWFFCGKLKGKKYIPMRQPFGTGIKLHRWEPLRGPGLEKGWQAATPRTPVVYPFQRWLGKKTNLTCLKWKKEQTRGKVTEMLQKCAMLPSNFNLAVAEVLFKIWGYLVLWGAYPQLPPPPEVGFWRGVTWAQPANFPFELAPGHAYPQNLNPWGPFPLPSYILGERLYQKDLAVAFCVRGI